MSLREEHPHNSKAGWNDTIEAPVECNQGIIDVVGGEGVGAVEG